MRRFALNVLLALLFAVNARSQDRNATAAFKLADAHDWPAALTAIDKALETDIFNTRYILLKATCLEELQRPQDAFQFLSRSIDRNPDNAWLYDRRGLVLVNALKVPQALADFDKALSLSTHDTMKLVFLLNRAAGELTHRDFTGAYKDLTTAYAIDSNNLGVLVNLANACDETGRGEASIGYLKRAINIDPAFVPAYGNLGFKYQDLGDHKTAISYYDKVISLSPNEALGYSNRSFNRLKLGDIKGAKSDIARSLEIYPANSYAYRIRALIALQEKRMDDACTDLARAIDLGFETSYGSEVSELQQAYCQ